MEVQIATLPLSAEQEEMNPVYRELRHKSTGLFWRMTHSTSRYGAPVHIRIK